MIENISRYVKLLRKYNKLETEYEALKEEVKDECFKKILEKIGEPLEIKRLREENKRLRIKVRTLKNELKASIRVASLDKCARILSSICE